MSGATGMRGRTGRVPAVLVTGWPASGKTTLARALAASLGAALLDLDTATGPMVAVVAERAGTTDLADPRLAGLTRGPRYETLLALAEDNLRVGTPVVLVAPFSEERRDVAARDRLDTRLRRAGGRPLLVWVRIRPDTLVSRMRGRDVARDAGKLADPQAFVAGLDPAAPVGPHLVVDGEAPVAAAVAAVGAALATEPAGPAG